jgi:hypothetical protein
MSLPSSDRLGFGIAKVKKEEKVRKLHNIWCWIYLSE